MSATTEPLFDITVWEPALNKYGAVVQLSVALYGVDEQMVCGPLPHPWWWYTTWELQRPPMRSLTRDTPSPERSWMASPQAEWSCSLY